ncbi:MAG: dimethylsulfonioproprionate lyase family protein, partial [Hyphomicrobiales bacterium]
MTKQTAGDVAAAVAGLARILIDMIEAGNSPPGDEGEIRELAEFARLLRPLSTATRLRAEGGARKPLPVCRFLAGALRGAVGGAAAPLAPPLEALLASLAWTQNPNYRRAPPADGFLDNYGWSEWIGERGAFVSDAIACGVLMLGPDIEYPAHSHEAEELYLPLAGQAWWRAAQSGWRLRP